MRLLIIEDDPTVRRLLEVTLRDLGDISVAGTDRAARYELMATPDVVVLDLGLPHLRWDILQTAVATSRVVVVTAHIEQSVLARATELGAHEVVTKPFRPSDLVEAVLGAGSTPRHG